MTEPHYSDATVTVHHGDCLDVLRTLPDASVDSVVTDPPYGLEFMGKEWDSFGGDNRQPFRGEIQTPDNPFGRSTVRYGGTSSLGKNHAAAMRAFQQWCELWAAECLRVLKPGGHLLAFGGTRTWHRLACAVEDAGVEVRDSIAWLYGSGFPKSLDVSKAIDKAAGVEREVIRERYTVKRIKPGATVVAEGEWGKQDVPYTATDTAPATPDAETWQGWGTALKPAFEPVVVARKPLVGTVAQNVLTHGTGALNIDGCRVGQPGTTREQIRPTGGDRTSMGQMGEHTPFHYAPGSGGRWPANVVLDETQADALDEQSGESASGKPGVVAYGAHEDTGRNRTYGAGLSSSTPNQPPKGNTGGASRFFYIAKADASERPRVNGIAHPTVKPLALMRWLVRLVTPPGGTVLEPFAGSGTTVEACIIEHFRCIAIERGAEYLPLIESRIARRRDPVRAIELAGEDMGLFDLDGEATA